MTRNRPNAMHGRRTIIVLLLAALVSAGCIGYSPDTARYGDSVMVRLVAYDQGTGAQVALVEDAVLTIGQADLGEVMDRRLEGARVGETVEGSWSAAGSRTALRSRSDLIVAFDVEGEWPRSNFRGELQPGQVVPFEYGIDITVVDVGNTTVDVRLEIGNQTREEYVDLGLVLVTQRAGDLIEVRIRSLPERPVFEGPVGQGFLGPGSYRTLGVGGGQVHFLQTGQSLAGDLRIEATILEVERSSAPIVKNEGEYGHRRSPFLGE